MIHLIPEEDELIDVICSWTLLVNGQLTGCPGTDLGGIAHTVSGIAEI